MEKEPNITTQNNGESRRNTIEKEILKKSSDQNRKKETTKSDVNKAEQAQLDATRKKVITSLEGKNRDLTESNRLLTLQNAAHTAAQKTDNSEAAPQQSTSVRCNEMDNIRYEQLKFQMEMERRRQNEFEHRQQEVRLKTMK